MVVLLNVSEYVPVVVGVAVGFWRDDVKADGPVHDHEFAFEELAFNVTVPPTQIGPSLVAPVEEGIGLTVAVVV